MVGTVSSASVICLNLPKSKGTFVDWYGGACMMLCNQGIPDSIIQIPPASPTGDANNFPMMQRC